MRTHDHDVDGGRDLRPKANRVELEDPGLTYRAVVAGRTGVLGAAGLLGLQRAVGNSGVGALVSEEQRSPVLDVVQADAEEQPEEAAVQGAFVQRAEGEEEEAPA